jgi:DNA-binding FadR family transcriptional regulator
MVDAVSGAFTKLHEITKQQKYAVTQIEHRITVLFQLSIKFKLIRSNLKKQKIKYTIDFKGVTLDITCRTCDMLSERKIVLKSIDKKDVVSIVFEQLREQIVNGNWKPGSKIPSESQLVQQLNVSRVSVRSAIQRLRDIGIIVTHQGKGSFVSNDIDKFGFNELKLIMHLSKEEFLDMMVFRQTIEFKCIELAVELATEEDLDEIKLALDKMLQHKDHYKKYSEADFNFHLAIAKASKNKVFYEIFLSIKKFYYYYLEELNRVIGVTLESVEVHVQVYQAIKNKDATRAKELLSGAMNENLDWNFKK